MDFNLEEKFKNILIIILGLVTLVLSIFVFVVWNNREDNTCVEAEVVEKKEEVFTEGETVIEEYVVDIKGAVKKPGVYRISKGSIVNDVIKMAGGLKSNASTTYINLSYELKNHDVINIFTKTEAKNNVIKEVCNCDDVIISDCNNSSIVTDGEVSANNGLSDKVNINTASLEELLNLNGVGESKAIAIIEYREKNKFTNIEDIKNVSGIGDSLYNKIKDYITV